MKKILSTLLSLLMIITITTVNINADEQPSVKQYDAYVAFGDSMSRGFNGTNYSEANNFNLRNVPGSYTYLVSQAIGCESPNEFSNHENVKYYPVCFMGESVTSALDIIGVGDCSDTVYDHGIMKGSYDVAERTYVTQSNKDRYKKNYQGTVKNILQSYNEDDDVLITIFLGLSDVVLKPVCNVLLDKYRNGELTSQDQDEANEIVDILKQINEQMTIEYKSWLTNYQTLITSLQSYCPNADILLIGNFNILKEMTLNDDMVLPVGNIANPFVALMNQNIKAFAKQYGCTYVDIVDAESSVTAGEWTITEAFGDLQSTTHPTAASMEYISRQIIRALPTEEVEENNYDIVVDLIRYNRVDSVYVNGIKMNYSSYGVEGTILTVNYDNPYAKTMVVNIKNDDGTISTRTYSLNYEDGHYVPRCIDSTNDTVSTAKKVFASIKNFFSSIVETAKGFFKKDSTTPEEVITPEKTVFDIKELFNKAKEKEEEPKQEEKLDQPKEEDEQIIKESKDVAEKVSEIVEETKEFVENNEEAKQTAEKAKEFFEKGKENIEKTKEFFEENKEVIEEVKENTEKFFEQGKENTEQFFKNFGENIKEKFPIPNGN